jgi:hypothetical protein
VTGLAARLSHARGAVAVHPLPDELVIIRIYHKKKNLKKVEKN